MKPVFLFTFVWFPLILLCQYNPQLQRDSLTRKLAKDSAHIYRVTIAKPYLKLENRNSFLAHNHVNFLGFLAGATLYEKHIVSAGYYFLDERSKEMIPLKNNSSYQQFKKLDYITLSYQYVLFNYRHAQLNLPFEAGFGDFKARISDSLHLHVRHVSGNFVPLSCGLQFILKPFRWFGVSASGGYREVRHDAVRLSFDGWYYSFGVWIDARSIIRDLKYNKRKKNYHRALNALSVEH